MGVGPGPGPGLTDRFVGEASGSDTISPTPTEMPSHTHVPNGVSAGGNQTTPGGNAVAQGGGRSGLAYLDTGVTPGPFQALAPQGQNFPHNNMQPYLTLNFCIAMQGVFPPRS